MSLLALGALAFGLALAALLRKPLPSLRRPWAFLLAPVPEVVAVFLPVPTFLAQGTTYTLVGLAVLMNREIRPLYLVLLGALMNLTTILIHGGMPVDPGALERAGLGEFRGYLEGKGDGLHYLGPAFPLGDWIAVPGRVLSPGDTLILLGLFLTPLGRSNHG